MNGGSVLLRIFTGRRSWRSRPKAAVSRSVRVGESGSSEAGVFKISRPAFRFRKAAPGQIFKPLVHFGQGLPGPRGLILHERDGGPNNAIGQARILGGLE